MKHVLLTRFAVRWEEGSPRRRWEERKGWVDYRINLFNKYCLPSVKAQTFKDFDWWLLIDPTFPGIKLEHIIYLQRCANILWITAPFREDQVEVGDLLNYRYRDQWVCSSRVDSDDVLRNDFMERVHELATEEEAWIGFRHGYMMKENQIAPREFLCNPFVSYVEYASPFRSVFKLSHKRVYKDGGLFKKIDDVPGWIQVDHSDNVKNLVSRKIKDFELKSSSASSIYKEFTWKRSVT